MFKRVRFWFHAKREVFFIISHVSKITTKNKETRITGSKLYLPCEPYDPDRVTGCPVPGWPCAYAAGLSHTTIYRIHAFWGVVGGGGDADGRAGAL